MELLGSTITNFTEQLASPAPVPGGGGASALVGAVGIALGDMVGELTVGKKKYADVEDELKELMRKAQELRVRLLACVEKDAAVNVKVNTKLMKDRACAEKLNAHIDEGMAKYWPIVERVYEDVYRRFC